MKFELVFIFLEVTTLAKKLCSPGKKIEENVFTPTNKYKKYLASSDPLIHYSDIYHLQEYMAYSFWQVACSIASGAGRRRKSRRKKKKKRRSCTSCTFAKI
jgi:hypothetical protein